MKFFDVFSNGSEVCYVFPFRLSVALVPQGSKENSGSQNAYEHWKEDVSDKLLRSADNSNSDFLISWTGISNGFSNNEEFVPSCFFKGKISNSNIMSELSDKLNKDIDDPNVSMEVNLIEIRLWEFGFGSIRIISKITKVGSKIPKESLFDSLEKYKIVISHKTADGTTKSSFVNCIRSKIVGKIDNCLKPEGWGDCALYQSFAEKAMSYKEINYDSIGELLQPRVFFKAEAVDESKYESKMKCLKKYLHEVQSEHYSSPDVPSIYISEDRMIVVSLQTEVDNLHNSVFETTVAYCSFYQYLDKVGNIYELFSDAYYEQLVKEKNRKHRNRFKEIFSNLFPRGRESIIVQERRNVNTIHQEIIAIFVMLNHAINVFNSSQLHCNALRCSFIGRLVESLGCSYLSKNVDKKYGNIEQNHVKIDSIASREALEGGNKTYKIATALFTLFIYSLRAYDLRQVYSENIWYYFRDQLVPLVIIIIILLFIFRSTLLYYFIGRSFEKAKILQFRRSQMHNKQYFKKYFDNSELWIVLDQPYNFNYKLIQRTYEFAIKIIYILLYVRFLLRVFDIAIKIIEYCYWLILALAIIWLFTYSPPSPDPIPSPSTTLSTVTTESTPYMASPKAFENCFPCHSSNTSRITNTKILN